MTPRWAILALVTLAHGQGALTALATVPLAPFLLEELALSRAQAGLFLPAVYLGGVWSLARSSAPPAATRCRGSS